MWTIPLLTFNKKWLFHFLIVDKLLVLFISLEDCIHEMRSLLNLSNAIRENLLSDVEIVFWEPGQYCICSLESGPQEPILWLWFDSLWISNGFAPAGIKLSDQMVKPTLQLSFLEVWHQGLVSWLQWCLLYTAKFHTVEPCRYFTERAELQHVEVRSVHRC